MTNEELVASLPNLSEKTFYSPTNIYIGEAGKDSYQYVYSLPEREYPPYKYLLDTGEVVKGATRVVFKDQVETHIGLGYTYLGIGLLHKKI